MAGALVSLAPASAADLHGDDEADRYVGTGGLILPGTVGSATRREVAECLGCQWRLGSPCVEPDAGNPFSGTPLCLSVSRGCADVAQLLRAWFRPPDGDWREIGLVCIGPGGPVTVADLGRDVRDWLSRNVPQQHPAFQPPRGVVTQLPVAFDSGQPARGIHEEVSLAGEAVELRAWPSWRWDFGDGASLTTARPGGRFPDLSVAHPYQVAATYRTRVLTSWSAEFLVNGLGPFPVTEPVTQSTTIVVPVGEGRAVLTGR
jgi:hypothetical protein